MALKRSLTLTHLTFYGVGTMVGAGIYSVIGAAAGEAGGALWISFVLAGIAALFTALSYAELSSAIDKAGAEYQFARAAFPKWKLLPFMAGYLIALNASATAATVALAFAGYLQVFFSDLPLIPSAFLLLLACTLVNIAGIRQATWVSIGLICIEVAGLLLIIIGGVASGDIGKAVVLPESSAWSGIFVATALIFFVFIGFEDVANLSEEANKPTQNIPKALLLGVIITSTIYVLVSLSVLAISTPEQLSGSNSPLTQAAANVKPWMGDALAVAALFATASTALISLVSISRLLFGMAREGDMPKALAKTLPVRQTPWIAGLSLFGAACALLPLGEVKIIASVSSFGVLLVFITVQAAMITLRYRQPTMKRGFRVPLNVGRLPLIPVAGIIITLALFTQFEPIVYAVGFGAISLGLLVYLTKNRFS